MKTIIVYKSSTGFTEKYALWLGEELSCPVIKLKEVRKEDLADCDKVIYGGGIRANMINGLNKFRKILDGSQQLYVFAVGATESSSSLIEELGKLNKPHLGDAPFFYFRGGMDLSKMRGAEKLIISMLKKSLAKKEENLPPKDKDMLDMMTSPRDFTDKTNLEPLLRAVK